ncbi:MAG TPA: carboxypeptidase-like regulatory domain-containing protein [Anaeromyxobacter sp.]|nr:carboxypeptidase-like regulatory domain-containing protein [Anaeromyxobacter sp.]
MKHRQIFVAAAFAAVIVASLLLVRPRGPRVAPASAPAPRADAAPATAAKPSAGAPARPKRAAPAVAKRAPLAPADAAASTAAAPAGAAAAPVDAPAPDAVLTGAIRGAVRDSRGEPIRGTTVLALSADGTDASETTTDDDGLFLLAGLRPGRYVVFSGLGTPIASRIGGRGAEVQGAAIARLDLVEPASGAVVRVSPRDARGRPADAQAVLVAGAPSATGAVASLLASDAIYLPELGSERTVLPRVPPGVYTLVVLQGAGVPARAARDPVRIADERELVVRIELAALAAAPRG